MRIVYDDAMSSKLVSLVDRCMQNLNMNIQTVTRYEYGMDRVQRQRVKDRLNLVLEDHFMEIGNTVTHANGIGNNCMYPVYYHAVDEIQHCANININSGLYGDLYVSVTDYNDKRISKPYKLTKHGVTINY